jgi:hypothetical protein
MKKVDLIDLKVGDKAWSAYQGCVEITAKTEFYFVVVGNGYYFNGKMSKDDLHPTLFHSEQEFRDYHGFDSSTLTKREQFAMAAMQGLLSANKHWSCGEILASCSVQYADALITKLNEKP